MIPRVDGHTTKLFAFGVGPGDLMSMKYRELEYFLDKSDQIIDARIAAAKKR